MKRTELRWLALILGIGVGLRVMLALVHPFWFEDSHDYDVLARAIVEHRSYVVDGHAAVRMPGYPLFVAAIYAVCGYSVKAVLVVQSVLGGATGLLVYLLGRKLVGGRCGLIAAGLLAVDPLSVGFSAAFLTEALFTFLLVFALWAMTAFVSLMVTPRSDERGHPLVWENPKSPWGRIVVGLLFAFFLAAMPFELGVLWTTMVFVRASVLWCLPLLVLCSIWMTGRRNSGAIYILIFSWIVGMCFVGMWVLRNYQEFDRWPIMTTLEGISLYEAVYPEADGGPRQNKIALPAEMAGMNDAERDQEWSRRAWGYIRSDPLRIAPLAVVKVGRTWSPWFNAEGFSARPIQWAMGLWYIPLLILAAMGVVATFGNTLKRELRTWVLLLIPVVYFTGVHALFLGSVRYRVPLEPIICIFAALGLLKVGKWVRRGKPQGGGVV